MNEQETRTAPVFGRCPVCVGGALWIDPQADWREVAACDNCGWTPFREGVWSPLAWAFRNEVVRSMFDRIIEAESAE